MNDEPGEASNYRLPYRRQELGRGTRPISYCYLHCQWHSTTMEYYCTLNCKPFIYEAIESSLVQERFLTAQFLKELCIYQIVCWAVL